MCPYWTPNWAIVLFSKANYLFGNGSPNSKKGEIPTGMYMRKIAPMHTNSDITDTTEINQSKYTCYIKPHPLHTT